MMRRPCKEDLYFFALRLTCWAVAAALILVILYIVAKGAKVVDWSFITTTWNHMDITQGGIYQAIVGSLLLGSLVVIFSIPIGIGCAIYLSEYGGGGWATRAIRVAIRNLAGVPSVVYGLFGLAVFVIFMGLGTSLLASSLTLACMTLPWVITASEEALKAVPDSFREGALALGATKWQMVRTSVLPYAIPGMVTGSIIGVARAMGETAPLIFTGAVFYMSYVPTSPLDKFMSLPYHLFILATQHASPYAQLYAAGTATVLIALVFGMTLVATLLRYRYRRRAGEWQHA